MFATPARGIRSGAFFVRKGPCNLSRLCSRQNSEAIDGGKPGGQNAEVFAARGDWVAGNLRPSGAVANWNCG
jgi:hypothetical protein